ncbi:hypothetical protein C8Q70DRAFT_979416 [Cubamyces menziesii]|nr:hypothetical protein C8Q70DRAFT_979416 [Cubamyces menziesii]
MAVLIALPLCLGFWHISLERTGIFLGVACAIYTASSVLRCYNDMSAAVCQSVCFLMPSGPGAWRPDENMLGRMTHIA